ncbi:MAG: 50S ribosomal protein L16 [Candidatus Diapherotrites archaeon]|nr:50S ribosomal protein L16 [Candidatus Diapherotrites archaeon]
MGLRPGHCYRLQKKPAYTRLAVTVPDRNYIGASPGIKTHQFNVGNPLKDFTHLVNLVADESVQIRDNSIEATRLIITKFLSRKLGKEGFFLKIRVYPHMILRENKQAQGAHADRIQKGMSHPFGKPVGRAARVRPGQVLMSILVDKENIEIAKTAILRARPRMTTKLHAEISTDVQSIGTKPRKMTEEKVEEKAEETKEGEAAGTGEGAEAGKEGGAKTETGKENPTGKAPAGKAPAGKEAAPKKEDKKEKKK